MDLIGVSRTIDHAVYTFLNTLAVILWKINSALMGLSMASYGTTDWLTGQDNEGIWFLLSRLIGVDGVFGVGVWEVFLLLAITLAGLSRVLRPFFRLQTVDLGRLLFFAVLSYVLITQGTEMMREAEMWRSDAGSYMYELMADSGQTVDLGLLSTAPSTDDPLEPPRDLDGERPLRGWEAVASSYFLATDESDLHQGVPPQAFLTAYCLYDPTQAIETQATENAQGCSPRIAWDEWDRISTSPITQVLGIPLPIDVSVELPIVQEHPENRQLGIRQAQAGVARLMLGPVVTLFPIIEANVGLMLTLAASFIYLSLPIVMLFGFFLQTETMATRLMMQLLSIYVRTMILQGMIALFLLILIGVSISGSLTAYLGLIGVGLIGGFFLTRMAASITKETLSTALGAVGGIWTGANVALLGEGARQPAEQTFGAAKLAGTAATLGLAAMSAPSGLGSVLELGEPALDAARSGSRELRGRSTAISSPSRGQMSPALLSLAAPVGQSATALPGALINQTRSPQLMSQSAPTGQRLGTQGWNQSGQTSQPQSFDQPLNNEAHQTSQPHVVPSQNRITAPTRPAAVTARAWTDGWYQSQGQAHGQQQIAQAGRQRFGETLHQALTPVLQRRSQAQTQTVLQAIEAIQQEGAVDLLTPNGRVSRQSVAAVQAQLLPQTATQFADAQGQRDLEILIASGAQSTRDILPNDFRNAVAQAEAGYGAQAPARTVPDQLGLDSVAVGPHTTSLNRFSRVSADAGLSVNQKRQLLQESTTNTVSPALRTEIETQIQQQPQRPANLNTDTVINSANALPHTLAGPARISLSDGRPLDASVEQPRNAAAPVSDNAITREPNAVQSNSQLTDEKSAETSPIKPAQPLPTMARPSTTDALSTTSDLGQQLNQTPTSRPSTTSDQRQQTTNATAEPLTQPIEIESPQTKSQPVQKQQPTKQDIRPTVSQPDLGLKPVETPPHKASQPPPNAVTSAKDGTSSEQSGFGQQLNQTSQTDPLPPSSKRPAATKADPAKSAAKTKSSQKPSVKPEAKVAAQKDTASVSVKPTTTTKQAPVAKTESSEKQPDLGQQLNQPRPPTDHAAVKANPEAETRPLSAQKSKAKSASAENPTQASPASRVALQKRPPTDKTTSTTKSGLGQTLNQSKAKSGAKSQKREAKPAPQVQPSITEDPPAPAQGRASFAQPWMRDDAPAKKQSLTADRDFVSQISDTKTSKPQSSQDNDPVQPDHPTPTEAQDEA